MFPNIEGRLPSSRDSRPLHLRSVPLRAKFFTNANHQKKAVYKQNDFGASVGGPIRVPKIYNGKNRSFFFFAFEGFRNREGATDQIRSVPTPEMYQGDFSNWVDAQGRLLTIYDPATTRPDPNGTGFIRDPFPGNIIPQNRFSEFSKKVMAYGARVTPNRPGLVPGHLQLRASKLHLGRRHDSKPADQMECQD